MYRWIDLSRILLKELKGDCKCCYFNLEGPVLIRYNFGFSILKETMFS